MDPLLCFPDPLPPELAVALGRTGHRFHMLPAPPVTGQEVQVPEGPWGGAVVSGRDDLRGALAVCRQLRRRETPVAPLLLVVTPLQLPDLRLRDDLFDDFCTYPLEPAEVTARLEHMLWRMGTDPGGELIEYGPLLLNLETYQAAVAGRVLDLTYMEYELLRFLAGHPGKVFTRETLLSRVWGYEYYGGARTVDVHVRRLRAKLGEEHAHLIQTVRSVGYRFGQVGWSGTSRGPGAASPAGAMDDVTPIDSADADVPGPVPAADVPADQVSGA